MSEIAAIAGSNRLRVSVRVSADALAVTGLALTCGLLVWLTWSTWGNIGRDTGYDFVAATRVAHGEWPYLDFVYYYGPLSPLLAGLAVWIGGGGLAPLIGFGLLLATAIVFSTYLLARRFVEPAWATVAAALTAPVAFSPNNFSYVAPHTYGAPLGILSILLFLWAAAHYAQSRSPRMLVLSGGFAGLVTVTRPEFVPAVILAAALWLGLRARTRDGGWREIVRFGSPLVAVPAVVYGAFLTRISLHQLIFDNLYPRRALAAGASHVLRLHAPLTFLSFAHLGAKLALYAFGAVLLVLLSNALAQARWIWRAASIALVAALAIAALARLETARYALGYAVGWIPAGVAAVVILLVLQRRRNAAEWSSADQAALLGAVVLTVLGAKEYDSFLVEASHPQPAVYLVPLAAIFLAVLHRRLARGARAGRLAGIAWLAFIALLVSVLTVKDARSESVAVHGLGGTLRAVPADGYVYQQALRWIERSTKPEEPIMLAPQLASLYTLSGRTDPFLQISLLPTVLPTAADQQLAIARANRKHVRLAIVDRRSFPEYGHTSFGGSFDRQLAVWLRRDFTRVAVLGAVGSTEHVLDVWKRRGS